MRARRRDKAPFPPADLASDEFLYVPEEEIPEALSIGAVYIEGDARLKRPRPLLVGVPAAHFERWQGNEARLCWCVRFIVRMLGPLVRETDFDALLETLGHGKKASERVYLWVPAAEIAEVRGRPGVHWDQRRRLCFATEDGDLGSLFKWLTPASKRACEGESVLRRALTLMMQDLARKEAKASDGADETPSRMLDVADREGAGRTLSD